MLWQLFFVSLRANDVPLFGSSEPRIPPDSGEIAGYWILASVILALTLFGFFVAIWQLRPLAISGFAILGVLALGCVLVFAVPTIDWRPDPVHHVNPNACTRTDSENCPGG